MEPHKPYKNQEWTQVIRKSTQFLITCGNCSVTLYWLIIAYSGEQYFNYIQNENKFNNI